MIKTTTAVRTQKPAAQQRDWFNYFNFIVLTLFLIVILLPFYYTVIKSFMTEQEFLRGGVILWPKTPTMENYIQVFFEASIFRSFLNTVFNIVVGVTYSMILTTTLAYGLSKRGYPGRSLVQNLIVFTMYFSGGLIPFFLVVKGLGLIGSRFSVIIPIGLNVFNVIILRTFFEQLPGDLEEAARIDGAGPLRIFLQISLPLVKPALATIVLFYSVDRWNEWFYASLFLPDQRTWPIQLQLRQILMVTRSLAVNLPPEANIKPFSEGIKSASMVITMIPIMVVYPFLQKYFVKGVMIGAIKS